MNKKFALLASVVLLAGCGEVGAGEVGMFSHFGEIADEDVGPGLQWYNPITTSLITMDVQSTRFNDHAPAFTQDLQTADVSYTVIFRLMPNHAVGMRRQYGADWSDRLLPSALQAITKNVFASFTAQHAVSQRPIIQQLILNQLRQHFQPLGIVIEQYNLTNIDFSPAFTQAIERAQVATQDAIAAQNHTVEVREQATQRVITANSEAESIRVQASAISANPQIVQLRAVEKWDGHLPQNMYGGAAMPFVDVARH